MTRADKVNEKRDALAQTIDLAPTILQYFDIPLTEDIQGQSIAGAIADDSHDRQASLYGVMGGQVNVTDGRYVYMRGNTSPDIIEKQYYYWHQHSRQIRN